MWDRESVGLRLHGGLRSYRGVEVAGLKRTYHVVRANKASVWTSLLWRYATFPFRVVFFASAKEAHPQLTTHPSTCSATCAAQLPPRPAYQTIRRSQSWPQSCYPTESCPCLLRSVSSFVWPSESGSA